MTSSRNSLVFPSFHSKDLKYHIIPLAGTVICYHQLCEAEDKKVWPIDLREEEKGCGTALVLKASTTWVVVMFGMWDHFSYGVILSPVLLDCVQWKKEHCFGLQACSQHRHSLSLEPFQRTGLTPTTLPWFYFHHFYRLCSQAPKKIWIFQVPHSLALFQFLTFFFCHKSLTTVHSVK